MTTLAAIAKDVVEWTLERAALPVLGRSNSSSPTGWDTPRPGNTWMRFVT